MQSSQEELKLELSTIARLLCLQPNKRRAIKFDLPQSIYLIEDRETDKPYCYIAFQPIKKYLALIKACPVKLDLAKATAKLAAQNELPWFILYNWTDSHFGLMPGADYFELDDWPKANDKILLPEFKNLRLLYQYSGQESNKIDPKQLFK